MGIKEPGSTPKKQPYTIIPVASNFPTSSVLLAMAKPRLVHLMPDDSQSREHESSSNRLYKTWVYLLSHGNQFYEALYVLFLS